jgi:hypothetical protein
MADVARLAGRVSSGRGYLLRNLSRARADTFRHCSFGYSIGGRVRRACVAWRSCAQHSSFERRKCASLCHGRRGARSCGCPLDTSSGHWRRRPLHRPHLGAASTSPAVRRGKPQFPRVSAQGWACRYSATDWISCSRRFCATPCMMATLRMLLWNEDSCLRMY